MTEDSKNTLTASIQERYKDVGKRVGPAKKTRPQKPCQFEGCNGWAWARGYCGAHYQLLKREGKLPVVRIIGDPVARFHASYEVNPTSGCWEWTGWIHPKGYGILVIGGKSKKIRAHRFSWELHFGPIPEGLDALHKCDNRKCCSPEHLFLGDTADNMRDCVSKGRHNSQIGTNGRKITPPKAMMIRILYARGQHSMQKLANIYGVDLVTVSGIVNGRSHLKVG